MLEDRRNTRIFFILAFTIFLRRVLACRGESIEFKERMKYWSRNVTSLHVFRSFGENYKSEQIR